MVRDFVKFFLLVASLMLLAGEAPANSCCGQSPASFYVLYQRQAWSLATSVAQVRTLGRAESNGTFLLWDDRQRDLLQYNLTLAASLSERWQLLFQAPFNDSRFDDGFARLREFHAGDFLLATHYEILPEYTFSYWRPHIFISGFINLPTGHSIYDPSRLGEGAGVTGHNQWGSGLGLTLRKVYFPWTLTLQGKLIRLFAKTFAEAEVSGFYDASLALLGNYGMNSWGMNFSLGLTQNYLSPRSLGQSEVRSQAVIVNSLLVAIQKSWGEQWGTSLSLSDQSLFGSPRNVLLNRSVILAFTYDKF